MKVEKLGPLGAVITSEVPAADVTHTVILAHGYGAPGTDLVGLAPALDVPKTTRFVFLQAPHLIEGMSGPGAGRAWWHIDMMGLHLARMMGKYEELAALVPDGIDDARAALEEALLVLERSHGLEAERALLGGFSQGAMLTMDHALRGERKWAGVVQLSGTMIAEEEWTTLMPQKTDMKVFQSHAPDDQVLPYVLAERLRDHLVAAGISVTFVPFRGGHGIGMDVLRALSRFITEASPG